LLTLENLPGPRGSTLPTAARYTGLWPPRGWSYRSEHPGNKPCRGAILIRWSKKDENHLALLQLASGLIAFKKAHHATTQPG
jgi:hypothetical protein